MGYRTNVQHRHTLTALLDAGVDLLVAEPDAVWTRNPLEDPDLMDRGVDIVGISDGSGGIGFGFIRIKSNEPRDVSSACAPSFDAEMRAAARIAHPQRADARE